MAIQKWSDEILLVTPPQDPGFTEDMSEVVDRLGNGRPTAVVVDFREIEYLNSSNLSLLLRMRKRLLNHAQPLLLCNINTKLWGTFLVTGIEGLFSFSDNVTTALTSLQADRQNG